MAKEDLLTMRGTIVDTYLGANFRIKLENGHLLQAGISGKVRKNNIQILLGDDVDVEMSVHDVSKGRIVYRHK